MRRVGMALVLAFSLAAVTAPVAAAAAPPSIPYHGAYDVSTSLPDAGLGCEQPVLWQFDLSYEYVDFFLKDGTVREVGHQVEQDTFTANGKTLVGNPYKIAYTALLSDMYWTTVYSFVGSGTLLSVTLPDGRLIQSSGRLDFLASPGPWWTPDSGHSGDIDAICEYFFG